MPNQQDPVQYAVEGELLQIEGLPKIEGHQVTLEQWDSFKDFSLNPTRYKVAAARYGISELTFYKWRNSPWWRTLFNDHVRESQEDFLTKVASKSDEMADALIGIITGVDKDDRTATARVNGIALVLKSGRDPMLETRNKIESTVNNFNSTGDQKVQILQNIQAMTPDQIAEYQRTGRIPS